MKQAPSYVISFRTRKPGLTATFIVWPKGGVNWYISNTNHQVMVDHNDAVTKHDLEYPEEIHERCREMLVDELQHDPANIAQWEV